MEALFLKILNMSITASWLIIAVIALRFIFSKSSKSIRMVLWGIVAVRLLIPYSIKSALSIIPSANTVPDEIIYHKSPYINSGVAALNNVVNPALAQSLAAQPENSINPMQIVLFISTVIWIVGIVIMMAYAIISYIIVYKNTSESVFTKSCVYMCDRISTPFIFGIFKPRIYIPSFMDSNDLHYVLLHENAHLSRLDHIWKPLGFILLTVYWFNPLMWIGYILFCRDIEFACDEKVLYNEGSQIKKRYSQALLNCSTMKKRTLICPLAFGEVGIKRRIKSVLNYRKPAVLIIVVSVIVIVITCVCFLTDPYNTLSNIEDMNLDSIIDNTAYLTVFNGEVYDSIQGFDKDVLAELKELNISSAPVSQEKNENRDRSNTLILQENDGVSLYSYFVGTAICFNSDFTEVYVNDGEKSTLSYRVLDSEAATNIFASLTKSNKYEDLLSLDTLKKEYPEFFGLDTSDGLTVFIWQTSEKDYLCYLMSTWIVTISDMSFAFEKGATMSEIHTIIQTYNLSKDDINVTIVENPLSDYHYIIDEKYKDKVKTMFWSYYTPDFTENEYSIIIDAIEADVDNDGQNENCVLSYGYTSGVYTFNLSVSQNGIEKYHNTFISDSKVKGFIKVDDNVMLNCVSMIDGGIENYEIEFDDGNVVLTCEEKMMGYWGRQGVTN